MNDNLSFFDEDFSEGQKHSAEISRIDVVKMQFLDAQPMSWQELFSGFNYLYAITYSSGISFVCDLIKKFDTAEIIFENDEESAPDILEQSSRIICEIFRESAADKMPPYMVPLTLENYFGEKETDAFAIQCIKTACDADRRAFRVEKKKNQLQYNTGQIYDTERILKELPENLEAHRAREGKA